MYNNNPMKIPYLTTVRRFAVQGERIYLVDTV